MYKYKKQNFYIPILDLLSRLILFILAIFSVILILKSTNLNIEVILVIYGIGAIFLVIQLNTIPIQKFGPAYSIMLYTILTQFGFAIVYLIANKDVYINELYVNRHLYINYLPQVFAISFVGCYSFFIGIRSSEVFGIKQKKEEKSELTTRTILFRKRLRENYLFISTIIIYIFAIVLLAVTVKEGLLYKDYSVVKEVFGEKSFLAYLQNFFWVAVIPIALLGENKTFKINIIPMGIIILILLLTGNRNDVLIPLAIGFSIYCLVKKRVPKILLYIGLLILFVINPAISATRKDGGLSLTDLSWGFSDALIEMGGQVNPFTVVVFLVENGFDKLHGLSLILPTISIFNLNIYYSTSDFLNSVFHIPNILALQDHYGQAFSMMGEMWLNFGVIGVVACYYIYGYYSNKIEKSSLSSVQLIFYGQFSILMMYWVRNSLMFNIIIIIFSVLLYSIIWLLSNFRKS
ncbi:O-antigen polysaccharide polymerase Wzy [Peribacillus frigoritolerans]|uniref:O-antigen polysaccharide polymerase Wzy n=1 Tax=Peribacillus frigoritolerans TaxID=450367 RepID=UPI0022804282|nr:O-antigen polysaccharide polymerase Wzy [Peribacillus frigoritolerans]MCY9006775.1 O-antigen polysaccharide polymerase Wzy [Peribacillus frigoritolerans]